MAGLTSLVSTFLSPHIEAGWNNSVTGAGRPVVPSAIPADKTDDFTQGQWWKNQAHAHSSQTGHFSGCRCGSCPMCAARVYQQNSAAARPPGQKTPALEDDTSPETVNAGKASAQENSGPDCQAAPEKKSTPFAPKGLDGEPLTQPELAEIAQLQKSDTRVKAHEAAHLAVAGALARSGAKLEYKTGPDGHRYAVAGEVSIDTSSGSSAEETLSKMRTVRAAALAPADPSPQDRKVAALAAVAMTRAVQEIRLEKVEEAIEQRKAAEQDEGMDKDVVSGPEKPEYGASI